MLTVFIFPLRLFATNRAPQNPPLPFIPNQPTDQPYRPLPRQLLSPRNRRKCQCTCGARHPIWFLEILYTPKPQMSDGHRPMHFWHFPYRYLWLRIFFLYGLTPFLVSMRIKFFWIPKEIFFAGLNSERIYFYWWDRCRLFPFLLIYPNHNCKRRKN